MSKTIKDHISRIRANIKANNTDSRITNRQVYSLMSKHRPYVITRSSNRIQRSTDMFSIISDVELEEVDLTDSCYISTKCKVKRTKQRFKNIIADNSGPIIKRILSLDENIEIKATTNSSYKRKLRKSSFSFNKDLFYWYSDGRFYFPKLEWNYVKIEAYFATNVDINKCIDENDCTPYYDLEFKFPDHLETVLDEYVLRDLGTALNIPEDQFIYKSDNVNV